MLERGRLIKKDGRLIPSSPDSAQEVAAKINRLNSTVVHSIVRILLSWKPREEFEPLLQDIVDAKANGPEGLIAILLENL